MLFPPPNHNAATAPIVPNGTVTTTSPLSSNGIDMRLPTWEVLQETTARLLFMAVRWVRCLIPFQTLSKNDQQLLLQVSIISFYAKHYFSLSIILLSLKHGLFKKKKYQIFYNKKHIFPIFFLLMLL